MSPSAPTSTGPARFAPSAAEEHALIRRIAAGDRGAFEDAYRLYRPKLIRFVSRLTSRDDLVEEVVNDTMVVVWQKAKRFRGDSRPSSWVLGIAYRITLKRLRTLSRRPEEELSDALHLVDPHQPEASLARRQAGERVRRAILRLSPEHRAVIQLTFFGDYAYREIAEIVQCPVNTIKTRMFHARKKLERLLRTMDHGEPRGMQQAGPLDRGLNDTGPHDTGPNDTGPTHNTED
ncbi:MAG: sigma-70 family RNA polymerase sigma factor [Acidobacteriota bacterium]